MSLLLPVRNGMRYLPATLESLRCQTYPDIEIIAVDDGSGDGTSEYLRRLTGRNIHTLESGGHGIVAALNLGISHATGEFLARQDADDLSHPHRIARQVGILRAHPNVDVIATCAEFIDADGKQTETAWTSNVRRVHDTALTPEQIRSLLPLTCCLVHGSVLLRTNVLQAAGGYRPELEWAEDYDLWLRLLPNHSFAKLADRLYVYRIHNEQVSDHRRLEQVRRTVRAKLEYIRRLQPPLPKPARTVIQGSGGGAGLYRELIPEFGMENVPQPTVFQNENWDLLIVTDFDLIERYRQMITASGLKGWILEGNFFVRQPASKM